MGLPIGDPCLEDAGQSPAFVPPRSLSIFRPAAGHAAHRDRNRVCPHSIFPCPSRSTAPARPANRSSR